jgi:diaminohydroxyphosphoribosylaminopyrimidine deaminase/5-amino-6-(5-phosphoribosylamino)uracil reductase
MGETEVLERQDLWTAARAAFDAAVQTQGATAPNPPVGCAVLDAEGRVLAIAAHAGAGQPHAEAAALAHCRQRGVEGRIDTLFVTLEPCNHTGRTPPCVQAILATPARRVLIGAADPNPIAAGGAAALRAAGLDVRFLDEVPGGGALAASSRRLIAPFARRVGAGLPWVTVKRALDPSESMIPPAGAKTFTSGPSLDLAHALRRRADAILTGAATILADDPLFTVRRVSDHPGKRRTLAVMDRQGRLPPAYAEAAAARGLDVRVETDLETALRRLAADGALEVLVEAGPTLSAAVLGSGLWDESIAIAAGEPDRVSRTYRQPQPLWEEFDVLRHR